jgi:hypothetical protein
VPEAGGGGGGGPDGKLISVSIHRLDRNMPEVGGAGGGGPGGRPIYIGIDSSVRTDQARCIADQP